MDIPEARTWSGAVRGARYRPVKQQLTLRINADLIDWFKRHAQSGKYQTDINRAPERVNDNETAGVVN